jgi:predicted DNA-binding ribbon-helix-helix protein
MEPSLSQALHLLNGETVHKKITSGKVIQNLIKEKRTNAEIISLLYVKCLGREVTEQEAATLIEQIKVEKNRQQALEDVFWAILNSREFVFNH